MSGTATLETLYKLRKEILKSNNAFLVSQIDHAIMKTYRGQLVFSFIGHFSAGKSSLVNHLLDRDILPSSPVPTTSNTVSVEIGEAEEIQAFIDQYRYIPLEDYSALRELNTGDLDIASISMKVAHPVFKEKTVFQDTPGVDSRTDSHEDSANRFLLNSDYIFFTVEYNHVESEHNLRLLKEISEMNIPFSLIINQIDKHDDGELSMDTFIARIKRTLSQWRIMPEKVFTTSIYDTPHNDVKALAVHISHVESRHGAYEAAYHERIVDNIERRQLHYLDDQISSLQERLELEEGVQKDVVEAHIDYLEKEDDQSRIAALHSDPDQLKRHIQDKVKALAKDSYLYPHPVKSAITEFLKVLSGDIKPGGFFGKQKKYQSLYESHRTKIGEEIQPVIQSEINAPVNALFDTLALEGAPFRYIWNDELLSEEDITTLSSQYIMNYLDKLKARIEKDVTASALTHVATLSAATEGPRTEDHSDEIDDAKHLAALLALKESLDTANYRHFYIHLDDETDKLELTEAVSRDVVQTEVERPESRGYEAPAPQDMDIDQFEYLLKILKPHPRYAEFAAIINEKLKRIHDGKVNISVFGGFSAGKTTFINALMGEARLTASPNPTTATITEISNEGESRALYKTEADIVQSLQVITNQDGQAITDFIPWIKRHKNNVKEAYIPFLNGILTHYDAHRDDLGKEISMSEDKLIEKISADEEAIFIHKAYLSVDNELTQRFSIVDSPGINSINERHTEETHRIISDSDMIIYVSYYNHVFSRSDERFLQYIKSIKGSGFPIIFIINAVDLMRTEADLEKVMDYTHESLDHLEISHKVFPVSSKQAVASHNAQFEAAKAEITEIANNNAIGMQYQSLRETANQLEEAVAANMRRYHNQNEEKDRIETLRRRLLETLADYSAQQFAHTLQQEIDIILSHTEKQLKLKLYDYLKYLISAADIKDRNFIADNLTALSNDINQHLGLELATSFNAVYHKADAELMQSLTAINEDLGKAMIASRIEDGRVPRPQPELRIDPQVLLDHQKALHKSRSQPKAFRSLLLELSEAIIGSIDFEALETELVQMADEYLTAKDTVLDDELTTVSHALNEPLADISETDYEEDQALFEQLKRHKGD